MRRVRALHPRLGVRLAGGLITLGPLRIVAFRMLTQYRPIHGRLLVKIPAGGSPAPIIETIERYGGHVVSLDVAQEGDRRSVGIDLELAAGSSPAVVAGVADIDGVLEVRWSD